MRRLDLQIKTKKRPLSTRGRTFTGTVISTKMAKTATIQWEKRVYVPKYERYEKKRTRIHAHIPDELKVEVGDLVKVMETRPISKTKSTLVIENITQNIKLNHKEENNKKEKSEDNKEKNKKDNKEKVKN